MAHGIDMQALWIYLWTRVDSCIGTVDLSGGTTDGCGEAPWINPARPASICTCPRCSPSVLGINLETPRVCAHGVVGQSARPWDQSCSALDLSTHHWDLSMAAHGFIQERCGFIRRHGGSCRELLYINPHAHRGSVLMYVQSISARLTLDFLKHNVEWWINDG